MSQEQEQVYVAQLQVLHTLRGRMVELMKTKSTILIADLIAGLDEELHRARSCEPALGPVVSALAPTTEQIRGGFEAGRLQGEAEARRQLWSVLACLVKRQGGRVELTAYEVAQLEPRMELVEFRSFNNDMVIELRQQRGTPC